jgi:cell division protein FtsN
LQVAAYKTWPEAESQRESLSGSGYKIDIVKVDLAGKGTWYRVVLGRFASEGEARKASEALRARGLVKEVMVRHSGRTDVR